MNSGDSPIQVYQQAYSNFELFCDDLRGHDFELRQLDRGAFASSMQHLHCGSVYINHFISTRRLDVAGLPPPGLITFGVPTRQCLPFTWRNRHSNGDTVQVYRSDMEISMITHPFFEATDVSMSEEYFNVLMRRWEFPEFAKLARRGEMVRCLPAHLNALRSKLQSVCSVLDNNPVARQQHHELNDIISFEIPYLIARALMSADLPLQNPTPAKRAKALRQAVDYIKETPRKSAALKVFCAETDVSERTLQRAFLDHYGVSAKSFAQAYHLNNAYKILLRSDPSTTSIAEIAGRIGFSHMSQFAKDYRRHFGELPSATLNASKG